MFAWIKCIRVGHQWVQVKNVPPGIAFMFGNVYCEHCGKTMYVP